MGMRPNFQDPVELKGSNLIVSGQSDGDPLPAEISVFLEQEGRVAGGPAAVVAGGGVDKLTTAWTATLPAEGFHAGKALGFGVEIRTSPFEASSWSEIVNIE
jgi:hypothetical protein